MNTKTIQGLPLTIAAGLVAGLQICAAAPLEIRVENFESQTIYHSPQSPGYTSWLGAWINPDGSLTASFTQATGPVAMPPNRDFRALDVVNKYLRSDDQGVTWSLCREDAARAPNGLSTHPVAMNAQATISLGDGTLIRRVNGEDVAIVDNSVVGTAYLERSAPGTTTWGDPIYLVDPATSTYQVSRIRKLRDGRLITTGQVWAAPAGQRRSTTPVKALMMVSSDEGLTWTDALTILETEPYMYPNEWDTAELPNGDLLSVWRSRNLANPGDPTAQVRNQALLRKTGEGWTMTNVRPAPFVHSGHPELLATREGVVLHIAASPTNIRSVIHYTADGGVTWEPLELPATVRRGVYYPRSVQTEDGTIYVFGHHGGDDSYGARDQSITMDKFRLKRTARPPYGLYLRGDSYFTNYRGQQEKYFGGASSLNGYNDPGGYWYYILPNGDLYEFTPPYSTSTLRGVLVAQLGTAYYNNPGWLTYSLFQRDGSYYTNYRGQQEKYLGGTASANGYNYPGGPWYYILPGGDLREFTPPYANPALTGVLLARLGTAYYNFPGLLPVKLYQRGGSYFTNSRGQQEKYLGGLVSSRGYSDPNGYWYYLLPNGNLYEFTPPYSNPALTGVLVEQLGPILYSDPSPLLTNRVQIP